MLFAGEAALIYFLRKWYERHFSHPEALLLLVLILSTSFTLAFFGKMLAPILAALVIAYLLEASVNYLESKRLGRILAVTLVFLMFLAVFVFLVVGLAPVFSRQLATFLQELPYMVSQGRELLVRLPELYPNFVTTDQIDSLTEDTIGFASALGQSALTLSLASIPVMVTVLVYLILGPVLVFFFLKDKHSLIAWLKSFLPADRKVLNVVWADVDAQIGNYIRGKFYEIFIVGTVTYVTFWLLSVSYAPLLAVAVGLSVIVPYIGAAVITIPVALAAYIQFGFGADFASVIVAYGVIQALDGNLLVPLLFSDVVSLHPIAIIASVLLFGGLWGFWGVFFAIPLATLVKSVLKAWPSSPDLGPT